MAKQNDIKSRYLDVVLIDNGMPIDLTGHRVRIYLKKPSGLEIFTQGKITDEKKGRCQFELTTQTLAEKGVLQGEVSIWSGETVILTTPIFKIAVLEGLRNDMTMESTNEYGALVVLFTEFHNALDLMNSMVENFGVAGKVAQEYGADTFWEMMEVMTARTELAIQYDVSGKIGKYTDTTQSTVFGQLDFLEKKFKADLNSKTGTSGSIPLNEMISSLSNLITIIKDTPKVIKSIQRGVVSFEFQSSSASIGIAPVNILKSFAIVNGSGVVYESSKGHAYSQNIYLSSLVSNCIVIAYDGGFNGDKKSGRDGSWQVIEFY